MRLFQGSVRNVMKQLIFTAILFLALSNITFAQSNNAPCPYVMISPPALRANLYQVNKPVTLTAETGKEIENYKVTYLWTITGGKILSGQNTKTITFIHEGFGFDVLVEIQGLPSQCNSRTGVALAIHRSSKMFDEYGRIPQSEEKNRIDKFLIQAEKNSLTIIRLTDGKNLKRRLNFLNSYIESKTYPNQVEYLISSEKDQNTQLWEVYAGSAFPDCKDCRFIEAEDIKKFIKSISRKSLTDKQ